MSMLAERKRKQKWSLNPRGKDWSQDVNKFGQKMLEKMGWQTGKGLGANENGITEHIKISYKNDSKGMGYKESNDQWTEHETNFSSLLESLTGEGNTLENKVTNSLEQKSQISRARVHYHKFTRGKDLSQYSEKDLANIFGKKSLKETKKQEIQKESDSESKECENTNELLVNAGSMMDYFKKKLPNFGKTNGYIIGNNGVLQKQELESNGDSRNTFGFGFNRAKDESFKSKNSDNSESESEILPSFGFGFNNIENSPKISKTKELDVKSDFKKSNKMAFVSYISEDTSNKRTAEDDANVVFSPKKKSKKEKQNIEENLGISNPAFNPMSTPVKIKKHSLNTIEESLTEEIDTSVIESSNETEKSINEGNTKINKKKTSNKAKHLDIEDSEICNETPKKKKKQKNEFSNPSFNEEIEESLEVVAEDNPYEVANKSKKKKKKNKSIDLEVTNPSFDISEEASINCSQNEENPYEVKVKKKNKKTKKVEIDNPNFDDTEETFIDLSQIDENPYEIKPNEKKKKKKSKKTALDNPSFAEDPEKPVESLNPYEIKPKKTKRKKTADLGVVNPALDLNSSNVEESTILEDCDLMLNIISTPIQKEEKSMVSIGSVSKVDSVKSRKSVRFSNVTQELIIPNNEELKKMYGKKEKKKKKNKGLDNINFDKQMCSLDENVNTLSKTLDNYQAEVENDINEEKIKTLTAEDIMVGEIGNPDGENEKLKDSTKLKFKYANFDTKTPFYMLDKVGAKKSYKHLIKGDILVKFKNTNLHEIQGYATKHANKV